MVAAELAKHLGLGHLEVGFWLADASLVGIHYPVHVRIAAVTFEPSGTTGLTGVIARETKLMSSVYGVHIHVGLTKCTECF